MKTTWLIALATALCAPVMMHAGAIYITTGQTGAQTQMDVNHDSIFTAPSLSLTCTLTGCATATISYFDPTFSWDLAGGDFTMKDGGNSTVADIAFSFFDSVDGLMGSVTYTTTEFCAAHGGNCQSFDPTKFTFATPITLLAGHHYYGTLTSQAVDTQSTAYFIKGLDKVGFDPNAPTDPNSPATPASTPEPGSVWMMVGGAASVLVFRGRK